MAKQCISLMYPAEASDWKDIFTYGPTIYQHAELGLWREGKSIWRKKINYCPAQNAETRLHDLQIPLQSPWFCDTLQGYESLLVEMASQSIWMTGTFYKQDFFLLEVEDYRWSRAIPLAGTSNALLTCISLILESLQLLKERIVQKVVINVPFLSRTRILLNL